MNETLDAQKEQWDKTFAGTADMFGDEPSGPARFAADLFRTEGAGRILELGGGQGRDTLFFATSGLRVDVLDYAPEAVAAMTEKARRKGLTCQIAARFHDIRAPLPYDDGTFDACYSHMLFCMALTTPELTSLTREVRRVLKPDGLHIYTVRHTGDAHYGQGIPHGDDMYETNGFIVHFFSREKVAELASGFEILSIDGFEEGLLPRKLFRVTLRKKGEG
jgi:SAM-dependent methyltransferase